MKEIIDEDVERLQTYTAIPAISVATINGGKITKEISRGKTVVTNPDDVDNNTIFEAASLSKPLFSYLILKLAENKVIDLDESFADLDLPGVKFDKNLLSEEDAKKFTARSILSHQSGLEQDRNDKFTFLFKPGEQYRYSGVSYYYLQKIIEHKTKKSLEQLAREYIFEPLHMDNSSFIRPESFKDKKIAVGHTFDNKPDPKRVDYLQKESDGVSANSLHTTAHDFALFIAELMKEYENNKTLHGAFDPAISQEKDAWANAAGVLRENLHKLHWGLGWGLLKTNEGKTIAYHWGDMGESKAFVAMNLNDKASIVYFSNSHNGLSIAPDLVSLALKQDCSPIFDFLFKKYGFEDYKTHDWKIKQALGTWHHWQKYEMFDKESFIADSVANDHLKFNSDPESRTLTIEFDPKKTGIIPRVIKYELELFKYNHKLKDEDCKVEESEDKKHDVKNNATTVNETKNQLIKLTINIPNPRLYIQFVEMLSQEKLLPAKDKLKLEKAISAEYGHTEAQSTTARLMSGDLARDRTAVNSANPTHEKKAVPHPKEHPKPIKAKDLADDESKLIFKKPTLKPPGH
jgi:CubicO group peptidase (beta-lactamase class C family)